MRVLFAAIAALGIVTLACSDGNGGGVTPTSPAGPQSTSTPVIAATPTPMVALSGPEWIPADLFGVLEWPQQFVADTVSGEIWELKDPGKQSRLVAWSPDGEALVSVTDEAGSTLYLGVPGEPLRHMFTLEFPSLLTSRPSANWSPDGKLLAYSRGAITDLAGDVVLSHGLIVDSESGTVIAELDKPVSTIIGWSADGRYVAFAAGSGNEGEVLVWDRESGLTVGFSGWSAVWSSTGARLAYGPSRSPDPAVRGPYEVRVRDFSGAGTNTVVVSRDILQQPRPIAWSADGRFLAISLFENRTSTLIIDMTGERGEVLVPDAEPHAWLGTSHTLLATGDRCGPDHVVTVEADGSGLRRYTEPLSLYPRASPDGRLVAFDRLQEIRLLTLATGEIAVLATGSGLSVSHFSIDPAIVWSPDSRYVVFGVPEGHDCPSDL